jgi:hypothetical protein
MDARLPGFSADSSVGTAVPRNYQHAGRVMRQSRGLHLAQQDPCQECWQPCMNDCRQDGIRPGECVRICEAECGCRPRDPGGVPCTPTDNSVNNTLCNAGITAWWGACKAICAVVTGPFAPLCGAGCDSLAASQRSSCPPSVICV